MAKQAIVRLQLDAAAKKRLDELCDMRGMTQLALLSRLVAWFGKQDELVQATVLNHFSGDLLSELARTLLERRAGDSSKEGPQRRQSGR